MDLAWIDGRSRRYFVSRQGQTDPDRRSGVPLGIGLCHIHDKAHRRRKEDEDDDWEVTELPNDRLREFERDRPTRRGSGWRRYAGGRKLAGAAVVGAILVMALPAAADTVDATTSLGTLRIEVPDGKWTSDQCHPVAVAYSFQPAVDGATYSVDSRHWVCPDEGSGRRSVAFSVTMQSLDGLSADEYVGVSSTFIMRKMKTTTKLTKATRAGSFAGTVSDRNSGIVVIQRAKSGRWITVTSTPCKAGIFRANVAKRYAKGTQFRARFRQTRVAMASVSGSRTAK